jgi:hypothetical protein
MIMLSTRALLCFVVLSGFACSGSSDALPSSSGENPRTTGEGSEPRLDAGAVDSSSSSPLDGATSNSDGAQLQPQPGVMCGTVVGEGVGNLVKAGAVPLADGGSYEIRDHCDRPIYMLGVTETCGICVQKLGQWSTPGGFFDELKAAGADVVLLSTDNPQGAPGSAATAEALRKRFNLGTRFYLGYETRGPQPGGFISTRIRRSGLREALILKSGNIMGAGGQVDDPAVIRSALGI